ncbi:MAG: hypothetical protein MZV49_12765 [Rhodopseudomonas palustris]|nr:hypothetical protein [Rhodopseudomonas palustris]
MFGAAVLAAVPATAAPAGSAAASGNPTPLIARAALFGNPERAQARLSPDGKYISFIAPRDGVLNVWVAPAGDLAAAKPVTNDRKRGIRQHFWAYDGAPRAVPAGPGRRRELAPVRGPRGRRRRARPDAAGRACRRR